MRIRPGFRLLAFTLLAALALSACVQVRHVDDAQLPAAGTVSRWTRFPAATP